MYVVFLVTLYVCIHTCKCQYLQTKVIFHLEQLIAVKTREADLSTTLWYDLQLPQDREHSRVVIVQYNVMENIVNEKYD